MNNIIKEEKYIKKNSIQNNKTPLTPMIQQYLKIKVKYPNTLVFYHMGDFYELFYDDAKKISKLLNLTLTKRKTINQNIPMAGIPYNTIEEYLIKLVKKGESIVICEQTNQFSQNSLSSKSILERKVIRIITPGTLSDEILLKKNKDNLLAAIYQYLNTFGYATLDISSGRFIISEIYGKEIMAAELARTEPAELLYPNNLKSFDLIKKQQCLQCRPILEFNLDTAYQKLNSQFQTYDLTGFGVENAHLALRAAGCLLSYAKNTQGTSLPHVNKISLEKQENNILMDATTRRNLELVYNIKGERKNTLTSILDHTATPMGSRMLQRWLHLPTRNHSTISYRQQNIHALLKIEIIHLQTILKIIGDLERILARIALKTARPKDLVQLKDALQQFPKIQNILLKINNKNFINISKQLGKFDQLLHLLKKAIHQPPPSSVREGGVIAEGYNKKLDQLRNIQKNSNNYLKILETQERTETKLDSLKICFNTLHGYFIQIKKKQSSFVPQHYIRLQTLKNSERYTISELKQYEKKIFTSNTKTIELEKKLYNEIFENILPQLSNLQSISEALAELDVLSNLAERAQTLHYICPMITKKTGINIIGGRHPIVEQLIKKPFISNKIILSNKKNMLIITGPNMGGKSTYMRQTALIVLLTYIGSFVPAKKATLGPIDKIFTRIGSSDDLASNRSTFMVEMTETANILHNATKNSLVLIDEIGRGTSTYDGLSLAWACAEKLAKHIQAMTLFSTHYFELTQLSNKIHEINNIHLSAIVHRKKITFLYNVENGPTKKSYGLLVAQLAGIPNDVINMAYNKLKELKKLSHQKNNENIIKTIYIFIIQKIIKKYIKYLQIKSLKIYLRIFNHKKLLILSRKLKYWTQKNKKI